MEDELAGDQGDVFRREVAPVVAGEYQVGRVGSPILVQDRRSRPDRLPGPGIPRPPRASAFRGRGMLFKVFCVALDDSSLRRQILRRERACRFGPVVQVIGKDPEQGFMPRETVGAGADPRVRMSALRDQREVYELRQDTVDGTAVELRLGGDRGLRRPAQTVPVGMGAEDEQDGQVGGAQVGMVQITGRNEPNPLPGTTFHAANPFKSSIGTTGRRHPGAIHPDHARSGDPSAAGTGHGVRTASGRPASLMGSSVRFTRRCSILPCQYGPHRVMMTVRGG